MRTIRTATFVSLDGVMQAPGGPTEDPRGGFRFGGWVFPFFDEKLGSLMDRAMGDDYDLLLGRCTYEIFAAFWPHQDDEIGRKFNAVNKYVAAGPDTPLDWAHSYRLEGDLVEAVRALKATFPIVLGKGRRLFDEGARPHAWTLESSDTSGTGVVVGTYRRAGEVESGSFADDNPSAAELERRKRWAREMNETPAAWS
jgi:dihydrofolate reductase